MVGLDIGSSSRAEGDPSCSVSDPDPLNLSWAQPSMAVLYAAPKHPSPGAGFVQGRDVDPAKPGRQRTPSPRAWVAARASTPCPVRTSTGRVRLAMKRCSTGSLTSAKTIGIERVALGSPQAQACLGNDEIRTQADQLRRQARPL